MYIGQEDKKRIAPLVNHVLKKYKIKGTLSIKPYMTLTLTISDVGDLDFSSSYPSIGEDPLSLDVEKFQSPQTKKCLTELLNALNNRNIGILPGTKKWYVRIKYPKEQTSTLTEAVPRKTSLEASPRRKLSPHKKVASPTKRTNKFSAKLPVMEKLLNYVSKFRKLQVRYSNYGANDSEASGALRDVVQGEDPNHALWSLFPGTPQHVYKELILAAKEIQTFVNQHRSNTDVQKYLHDTSNLRYI